MTGKLPTDNQSRLSGGSPMQEPDEGSSRNVEIATARRAEQRRARVGRRDWSRLAAGRIPAFTLVLAALLRIPTLTFPMTEVHAFRQTQTAFPAVIYARDGIDLLRPSVPVVGPPWILPFEFPLFQAVGSLLIGVGIPVEIALRSLALASFLGTAALLWTLVRRNVSERTALIALVLFVVSPFSILFSRVVLVEYSATLGALLFVYAALEWRRTGARRWLTIALFGGSIAALVKITTAVFWLAPVLLTRRLAAMAVAGGAAGLALAWTHYADTVKAANPYAAFLASDKLVSWNFGGDRLDPANWAAMLGPIGVTAGMLLVPFGLLVVFRRERLFWTWMAIALIGPMFAFTNLYVVHDYYAAAVTPALAALIAGGIDLVMDRYRRLAPLAITAIALVMVIVLVRTAPYWSVAFRAADPDGVLADAAIIRALTSSNDVVATISSDWSPARFYYAGRRGYALQADVDEVWGLAPPAGAVVVQLPRP